MKEPRAYRLLTLAILGFVVLSGFSGCPSNTPTESSSVYYMYVSGTFSSADGPATIREFHVLLDGTDLSDPSRFDPPVAQTRISSSSRDKGWCGRTGAHSLALRLAAQTQSPTTYQTSKITVELVQSCFSLHNGCPTVASVELSPLAQSLSTGGQMTWNFSF